jgi:hypothetical protein
VLALEAGSEDLRLQLSRMRNALSAFAAASREASEELFSDLE